MEAFLLKLETTLNSQSYLVGDAPCAADVVVALCLSTVDTIVGPAATTYTKAMCALPVIKDVAVSGVTDQLAAVSMDGDNIVLATLADFSHQVYSHVLCKTAEELVTNVAIPDTDSHTKNLLFKDKKHGMFLIVLATKSHLDTKALGAMLGLEGKVNMRLADEATLDAALGVKPGCVGPLCIVNDKDNQITIVLDQALMNVENVHSHPLRNDMGVIMKPNDLKDYITKTGHEVTILEFGVAGDASAPAAAAKPKAAPAPKAAKKVDPNKKVTKKGETLLALQWKKSENFSMWYSDVIVLSEMISYYDISGCYILRPWSYKIWELITAWFNGEVSSLGRRRCCLLGLFAHTRDYSSHRSNPLVSRIPTFPCLSPRIVWRRKRTTLKDSAQKWHGSPNREIPTWPFLLPFVQPVKPSCTLPLVIGSRVTVICLSS